MNTLSRLTGYLIKSLLLIETLYRSGQQYFLNYHNVFYILFKLSRHFSIFVVENIQINFVGAYSLASWVDKNITVNSMHVPVNVNVKVVCKSFCDFFCSYSPIATPVLSRHEGYGQKKLKNYFKIT